MFLFFFYLRIILSICLILQGAPDGRDFSIRVQMHQELAKPSGIYYVPQRTKSVHKEEVCGIILRGSNWF